LSLVSSQAFAALLFSERRWRETSVERVDGRIGQILNDALMYGWPRSGVDGGGMKPSSSFVWCLGVALLCAAAMSPASAATKPGFAPAPMPHMRPVPSGKGVAHFAHAHPQRFVGMHGVRRNVYGQGDRDFAFHHHMNEGQSVGWGYGYPYLSGSFPSGLVDEGENGEGMPAEVPPGYVLVPIAARPAPCVTPLVIVLKHRRRSHMPRIVYGSPSYCPPPMTADLR
jgi:hypothetical protein